MTDRDQAALNRLMLLAGCAGGAAGLLGCAAASLAVAPQLCLLAAAGLAYRAFRPAPLALGDSCGSARFADPEDLLAAGAFDGGPGLLVGEVPPPPLRDALRLLRRAPWRRSAGAVRVALAAITRTPLWARLKGVVHSATVSPSGAGKTTSMVTPQLLTDDDSAVVIDPSGEIHAATAAARRARGHAILLLDPAHLTGGPTGSLNPMAGLHPEMPDFLDRCRGLADALCPRPAHHESSDPHWVESAILWTGAIIAWVAFVTAKRRSPELCNLQTVADILADQQELDTSVKMMKEEKALGGMLARLAHKLGHAVDRERGSILSTVGRSLAFLDTPQVAAVTANSTFDPAELPAGKVTVYVVIRPDQLREKAGLVRAWLTALLWGSVRAGASAGTVHYHLDEYAALGGRLQVVEDALTQYRKFSVRCHFYLQSIGQLVQCFGEGMDKTFLANVTQVFLGVTDLETADYVSRSCGTATVATLQQSTGGNTSSSTDSHGMQSSSSGSNDGASAQEAARALLTPDEVTRLGRVAVTLAPGMHPVLSRPARFFEPAFPAAQEALRAPAAAAAPLCALLMALGLAAGALAWLAAARLYAPQAPPAPNVRPHPGRPTGGPRWQKNESRGPRRAPPASWPPPP